MEDLLRVGGTRPTDHVVTFVVGTMYHFGAKKLTIGRGDITNFEYQHVLVFPKTFPACGKWDLITGRLLSAWAASTRNARYIFYVLETPQPGRDHVASERMPRRAFNRLPELWYVLAIRCSTGYLVPA